MDALVLDDVPLAMVGVGAVLALLLIVGGVGVHRRLRVTAARAWAAAAGWQYVGTDDSFASRWRGWPFGVGRAHRVSELITGTFEGRPAASFGYTYRTDRERSSSTHRFHLVVVGMPAPLPDLVLAPPVDVVRIARFLPGTDVQFESEEFNRAWRAWSPDAKLASDVVHPRLMERLLQADARGVRLRIEGADVLSWAAGRPRLDTIDRRLRVMCAVVDAVPRFVWLDHGYDPLADDGAPVEGPQHPPRGVPQPSGGGPDTPPGSG